MGFRKRRRALLYREIQSMFDDFEARVDAVLQAEAERTRTAQLAVVRALQMLRADARYRDVEFRKALGDVARAIDRAGERIEAERTARHAIAAAVEDLARTLGGAPDHRALLDAPRTRLLGGRLHGPSSGGDEPDIEVLVTTIDDGADERG